MAVSPVKALFLVCFGLTALATVMAADPDPLADFTLPTVLAKDVVNTDFVFNKQEAKDTLFKKQQVFNATQINKGTFPILSDQGISLAILNFPPGTQNTPHEHPRATEILFVIKGKLTVGLADTTPANMMGPRFFENVVRAGEAVVFPRGLAHFQINKSKRPVIAVAALNSANPGTVRIQEVLAVFANVLGTKDDEYNDKYYESPKYESPKYESPKYESPKYESPKYESPKYESPKYESPKYESPKYESPKYESPKYESPKYESPKY